MRSAARAPIGALSAVPIGHAVINKPDTSGETTRDPTETRTEASRSLVPHAAHDRKLVAGGAGKNRQSKEIECDDRMRDAKLAPNEPAENGRARTHLQ